MIEMRGAAIEPREIIDDSDGFTIRWADGAETVFNAPDLRRNCACAGCVDEWTGRQTLKTESIADDLQIEETKIVGRYALNFVFSDKHETGIYSFKYLRELAERQR